MVVTLRPHGLPRALLHRLCAGDDDLDDLDILLRGRRSKSALLLRIVRDLAVGRALADDTRTTLTSHVTALTALERVNARAVAEVLEGPHFAAWAAHSTRRLTGRPTDDAVPLDADLGHLGAFVGAAALRAGADVAVSVPVRDGWIVVPATGRVRAPGAGDVPWAVLHCGAAGLRVESSGSTVTVPAGQLDRTGPDWSPVAIAHGRVGPDRRWVVAVDPDDPYLRFFGRPGAREAVDTARWSRRFAAACALVDGLYTNKATAMARTISCLVPLTRGEGRTGLSATSGTASGAVALTEPPSALGFAATLVHEHQHLKLNALHDLLPLVVEAAEARYYSPWRDDPRPASGLLQGAFAFLGIADFWSRVCRDPSTSGLGPHLELARTVRQLGLACATLDGCPELTAVGAELAAHLAERARGWETHPVPSEVARVADDLVLEHRVRWRLRHLAPAAAEASPADEPAPRAFGTESDLVGAAKQWVAGRRPASIVDRLILDGRYAEAQAHLEARLRTRVAADDWIALVVVAAHTDLAGRCPPLHSHPELAYALYREMRRERGPVDVTTLVPALADAWARYVAGTSISLSVRM